MGNSEVDKFGISLLEGIGEIHKEEDYTTPQAKLYAKVFNETSILERCATTILKIAKIDLKEITEPHQVLSEIVGVSGILRENLVRLGMVKEKD